jgi:ferredoxin-NADP reductase
MVALEILPNWGEFAGILILGGSLLVVGFDLAEAVGRRRMALVRDRQSLNLFRERMRLDLELIARDRQRHDSSWEGVRKFKIDRKVMEADGICSFYLKPHDGKPLPPFNPGQYLTFQLKIPGQAKPVTRCYSLSDTPLNRDYYRVTIKRVPPPPKQPELPPGLASGFFHGLEEGTLIDVRAPAGNFYLDTASNRPVVLMAGGVGLTPVMSMLNTICASGSKRETWFVYGAVNRLQHAMYDHLAEIAQSYPNVRIVIVYSHPTETCVQGRDYHEKGFVDGALLKRILPSNNYEFYTCGPPPMMDGINKALREWGVPESDIRFEAFGSPSVKATLPTPVAATGEAAPRVTFTRSGKTIVWSPKDSNILDVAEANGVTIDSGCRAGNCGTCETAIRGGSVTYPLTPGYRNKEGTCLVCVAIPQGEVVIDA